MQKTSALIGGMMLVSYFLVCCRLVALRFKNINGKYYPCLVVRSGVVLISKGVEISLQVEPFGI